LGANPICRLSPPKNGAFLAALWKDELERVRNDDASMPIRHFRAEKVRESG